MNIYDGVTVAELLEGYGIYKQLVLEDITNILKGEQKDDN